MMIWVVSTSLLLIKLLKLEWILTSNIRQRVFRSISNLFDNQSGQIYKGPRRNFFLFPKKIFSGRFFSTHQPTNH